MRDRGEIGMDLLVLLCAVDHQIGGQDVAWTVALASASPGRSLRVIALLRSAVYPFELASTR